MSVQSHGVLGENRQTLSYYKDAEIDPNLNRFFRSLFVWKIWKTPPKLRTIFGMKIEPHHETVNIVWMWALKFGLKFVDYKVYVEYCNSCNFKESFWLWSIEVTLLSWAEGRVQLTELQAEEEQERIGGALLRCQIMTVPYQTYMTLCAEQHKGCFRGDQWQVCWAGREAALRHPSERSRKKTSEDSPLRKSKNLMKTPPTKKVQDSIFSNKVPT